MSKQDFKVGDLVVAVENYLELFGRADNSFTQRLKDDYRNRFLGRKAIVLEDHANPAFMVSICWIDTGIKQHFNAGSLKKLNKD